MRPWGATVIDLFNTDYSSDYGFEPSAAGSLAGPRRRDFRPARGAPRVWLP
ncbi:hypothetical protein [Corallococcus sp. RDP092CA]|uniref:hypothetical protein n=1 Tax=Corallococcus sp. RDP092CA TaxID=3109369 RepID=UPI0035B4D253